MLTEGLAAGREMPRYRVLHHLEQHRAVAGGANLELVEQLNCFRRASFKPSSGEQKQTCVVGTGIGVLLSLHGVLGRVLSFDTKL